MLISWKKIQLRTTLKIKDTSNSSLLSDNDISLRKIIINRLIDPKFSQNNINLILEKSNNDRIKLYNEIDKILIFFQQKDLNTDKLNFTDANVNEDFTSLKDAAF